MNEMYFAFIWMTRPYIVKAQIIKETKSTWFINSTSQITIFGDYAFLQSEVDKRFFCAFSELSDAVEWHRQKARKEFAEYARILCLMNSRIKKLDQELNKFLEATNEEND